MAVGVGAALAVSASCVPAYGESGATVLEGSAESGREFASQSSENSGFLKSEAALPVTDSGEYAWVLDLPEGATAKEDGDAWLFYRSDGGLYGVATRPMLVGDGVEGKVAESSLKGNLITATVSEIPEGNETLLVVGTELAGGGGDDDMHVNRYVGVPSNYHYDPLYTPVKYRFQHDYCSLSPDSWGVKPLYVNFRGPCAIHDMCYERYNDWSKQDKINARNRHCQDPFHSNMRANCNHQLSGKLRTVHRLECRAVARGYYATVKRAVSWQA